MTDWLGQADGGFVSNQANAGTGATPAGWTVAGVADFNGDGKPPSPERVMCAATNRHSETTAIAL